MGALATAKGLGPIVAFTALALLAAVLLPAMPQSVGYHGFADRRAMFGIANFLDVASNVGFLLAGIAGLVVTLRTGTVFAVSAERWPYGVFFTGLLLTAAGSAWYHLDPDNERLFWDRLPITVAFMSLIAAQVVDRIDVRTGLVALVPMLLVGTASVVYWRATERAGAGNVVPYGVLQAWSLTMLLLLVALHRSRYTHGHDILWVLAAYAVAKLCEHFDAEVLALGDAVSGHTLKHLAAAASGLAVWRMLLLRTHRRSDIAAPPALA